MSIFKEFSISSRPESDEPVVIYDKNNNNYTCINNFVFDILYYKKTSKIRRWCGEDRERKNIFKYYSSDVKWAYMKDIVKIFSLRLTLKNWWKLMIRTTWKFQKF